MARKRLDLNDEERRVYDNEMHRKQTRVRREKAKREALKSIVGEIVTTFENLGWSKTDLVVGANDEMVNAVVDELLRKDSFKVFLGGKYGIRKKGD